MSEEGDTEYWRAWRENRQDAAHTRAAHGFAKLRTSELMPWLAFRDTSVLLRHPNVLADYWPHAGKWRDVKTQSHTMSGGVDAFIAWAQKRIAKGAQHAR